MSIAALLLAQAVPGFAVSGDPRQGLTYTARNVPVAALAPLEEAVAADARRRCGTATLSFGRFSYDQQVAADGRATPVKRYRREIGCGAGSAGAVAPVPADWTASASDEAAARAAAEALFAAYDRGDVAAVVDAQEQRPSDVAAVGARVADWHWQAGAGRRVIDRVTWYPNPASAPKPGLYVALDWHAEYPALAVGCGYVVLYRTSAGYRVTREETNMLQRTATLTPDAEARARALLPCR